MEVELQARGRAVEKLFTLSPGADSSRVRVRVEGAGNLRIDDDGALRAQGAGGKFRNVDAIPNPSPADAPAGIEFPFGFLSFRVIDLAPGSWTNLTSFLHDTPTRAIAHAQ